MLWFAVAGITFLAACIFSDAKYYYFFGAGVPILFFFLCSSFILFVLCRDTITKTEIKMNEVDNLIFDFCFYSSKRKAFV